MKKKVMVVDDEPDIVEFLTDLLEEEGYAVTSASDGAQALERVKEERPDLVLLDVSMPKKTGTDFYRQFSRRKEFKDIPVIIVSGHPSRRIAVSKKVTNTRYEIDGGYRIPGSAARPAHIAVAACQRVSPDTLAVAAHFGPAARARL